MYITRVERIYWLSFITPILVYNCQNNNDKHKLPQIGSAAQMFNCRCWYRKNFSFTVINLVEEQIYVIFHCLTFNSVNYHFQEIKRKNLTNTYNHLQCMRLVIWIVTNCSTINIVAKNFYNSSRNVSGSFGISFDRKFLSV